MERVLRLAGNRTDVGLHERFRNGDAAAFERIVTEHRRAVYSMARRLLGSHAEADEASQQTFVRAWRGRSRFRGDASIRTWLIGIALNVARSMRGRPRGGEVEIEFLEHVADRREGADERLHREEARERVRRAVAKLPPRQREVVTLKVFSELTYREVAGMMELSEGAVKAHLHQAVANLRSALVDDGGGGR